MFLGDNKFKIVKKYVFGEVFSILRVLTSQGVDGFMKVFHVNESFKR